MLPFVGQRDHRACMMPVMSIAGRSLILTPLLALCLGGCGGGGTAVRAAAPSPSPTPSATKWAQYQHGMAATGIDPDLTADEFESVAANTCDNTVAGMEGFASLSGNFEEVSGTTAALVSRLVLVRVMCPDVEAALITGFNDYQPGLGDEVRDTVDGGTT
jgi:hypothetical protein